MQEEISRKSKIDLIASKFAYMEDLLEALSDNEIKRLYEDADNGEFDEDWNTMPKWRLRNGIHN